MNTKVISLIVAGVILIGGGALYLSSRSAATPADVSDSGAQATDTTARVSAGDATTTTAANLADLVMGGGNYQCAVAITMPSVTSNGTVFVSGKDIRASFQSTAMGRNISTDMLQTGGFVYTWTNLVAQGSKAAIVQNVNPLAFTGQTNYAASDNFKYNCKSWVPERTTFAVPASITFVTAPASPSR